MPLVQAAYNVRIRLANVPVMQVIRAPSVMLLVGVIPLVQVALHVISLQVNVSAMQDTKEPHAIPVILTSIMQVYLHFLLVQVSISTYHFKNKLRTRSILYLICSLWL